jgi:hypothetical protein
VVLPAVVPPPPAAVLPPPEPLELHPFKAQIEMTPTAPAERAWRRLGDAMSTVGSSGLVEGSLAAGGELPRHGHNGSVPPTSSPPNL